MNDGSILQGGQLNPVPVTMGGTGGTTAATARTALGVGTGDSPTFASVNSTNGTIKSTVSGTLGSAYGGIAPILVYAKSVPLLTAGAPADIGTIVLPSGITRWTMGFPLTAGVPAMVAETAAGSLALGTVTLRDAASGAGNAMTSTPTMPTTVGTVGSFRGATVTSTSGTIYINQTVNSGNAGTVSFYVVIQPML